MRIRKRYKNVALLLGISTNRMISILKDEGVILNTNGRNMPIPMYVGRGWFIIDSVKVENDGGFKALVPVVDVTEKGITEIERIVNNTLYFKREFKHLFNQISQEVMDYTTNNKIRKNQQVITEETDKKIMVLLQNEKSFKTILKFDKITNTLWATK